MSALRVLAVLLLSTAPSLAQVVIPAVPPTPHDYYYDTLEQDPLPWTVGCRPNTKCAAPSRPSAKVR